MLRYNCSEFKSLPTSDQIKLIIYYTMVVRLKHTLQPLNFLEVK